MKFPRTPSLVLALGAAGLLPAHAQRPPLDVHRVGDYGFCPWAGTAAIAGPPEALTQKQRSSRLYRVKDMNLAIRNVWIRSQEAVDTLDLSKIRAEVEDGWQYAPKRTMVIRIDFWDNDGRARYKGPTQPPQLYWERLAKVLSQLEPVMDQLEGISLSEENTINTEERLAILQFLYEQTKRKYPRLTVFQWLTPDYSIPRRFYGELLPADGWIINPYGIGGPRYQNARPVKWLIQKYLVTGKPLIFVPNAANQKVLRDLFFINSKEQLQACEDFNLPTVFYWSYSAKDSDRSTVLFGYPTHDPVMDQITESVLAWRRRTSELPEDFAGNASVADTWENPPLNLRVHPGMSLYRDDFSESRFLDESRGSGFRDLVWDGGHLKVRGFRGRDANASIQYRFISDKPMRFPTIAVNGKVEADLGGSIRISASADEGKTWASQTGSIFSTRNHPPFRETSKLWVTVDLEGRPGTEARPPVSIDDLAIFNDGESPGSPAIVTNFFDAPFSKEKFRQEGKAWSAPLNQDLDTLTPLIYFSADLRLEENATPFSCTLRNEKSRGNTGIGFRVSSGPNPKLALITEKSLKGPETAFAIEIGRRYRIEIEADGITHRSNVYVTPEGSATRQMIAEKIAWDAPNRLVHELSLIASTKLEGITLENLALWSVTGFPLQRR